MINLLIILYIQNLTIYLIKHFILHTIYFSFAQENYILRLLFFLFSIIFVNVYFEIIERRVEKHDIIVVTSRYTFHIYLAIVLMSHKISYITPIIPETTIDIYV